MQLYIQYIHTCRWCFKLYVFNFLSLVHFKLLMSISCSVWVILFGVLLFHVFQQCTQMTQRNTVNYFILFLANKQGQNDSLCYQTVSLLDNTHYLHIQKIKIVYINPIVLLKFKNDKKCQVKSIIPTHIWMHVECSTYMCISFRQMCW